MYTYIHTLHAQIYITRRIPKLIYNYEFTLNFGLSYVGIAGILKTAYWCLEDWNTRVIGPRYKQPK